MFSVASDNPFIIFRHLQKIARDRHGEDQVIDLSRGDPGYGFVPSAHGRMFASYVLELDTAMNESADQRFLKLKESDLGMIEEQVKNVTGEIYHPAAAETRHTLLKKFTDHAIKSASEEGKQWTQFDVLRGLFSFCPMSGGSYLDPKGQELSRVIIAKWHREEYGVKVTSDDLILTNGVSHGIGTVFKTLGEEGCGYLSNGDSVVIGSPVYAPYLSILKERGIDAVTFNIDPVSGEISDLPDISSSNVKALILIDPNNPTGFSLSESDLEKLAGFARKHDLLIITDEVYYSFFPRKKTMLHFAPERTICLNSRSKIERSTGLRFGEIITLPEGRKWMASKFGVDGIDGLEQLLIYSKAPGRAGGQFQHTTFVPGPAQLMGISHLVLGSDERESYKSDLAENGRIFAEELELSHKGNLYYTLFDLNSLSGCATQNMPVKEKLIKLAEEGVIFLPAYQFFAESERSDEHLSFVRASVVNTTPEKLKIAAERTRSVLC